MRFPMVPRGTYEASQALVAELRAECRELRRQCGELTTTVCAMKMQGAAPIAHAPAPAAPRTPDLVAQAIQQQVRESSGDEGLRAYLWAYARDLKADGKSPEEIAGAMTRWESSETWSAPVDSYTPAAAV